MNINKAGLDLIKEFEGLRLNAYADIVGVWTIGYGHTKGVKKGQKITEAQAEEFLKSDLKWAEEAVSTLVSPPLNENQFAALVSLIFNIGASAFKRSTLLKKLNAGDFHGACMQFKSWSYAGGNFVPGLQRRRLKEMDLFVKEAR